MARLGPAQGLGLEHPSIDPDERPVEVRALKGGAHEFPPASDGFSGSPCRSPRTKLAILSRILGEAVGEVGTHLPAREVYLRGGLVEGRLHGGAKRTMRFSGVLTTRVFFDARRSTMCLTSI